MNASAATIELPTGWGERRENDYGDPCRPYYERADGAYVWFSDSSPHLRDWRDGGRFWTAYPPGKGHRLYLSRPAGNRGMRGPRRWKSPQNAMAAVDREFPLEESLTEFERKILAYLRSDKPLNGIECTWGIAQAVFPEIWYRSLQSRPGIVSQIDRAGRRLDRFGLAGRLPKKDQWGATRFFAKGRHSGRGR